MERASNKKRARNHEKRPQIATSNPSKKRKWKIDSDLHFDEIGSAVAVDASIEQPGIFEFPWNKGTMTENDNGSDLRDVFFSSLVDGCKAAIGVPGDRLSNSSAEILLPREYEGDGDCIWSSVLREPLSLRCVH